MNKILISVLALACSFSLYAKDVAAAQGKNNNMVLTDEECESSGYKFHALVDGNHLTGCYFVSQNGFVVMKRDDNDQVFVYPIVIFHPITGV